MSSKILIVLIIPVFVLIGSILAQTPAVKQQGNSNNGSNSSNANTYIRYREHPLSRKEARGTACEFLTRSAADKIYGRPIVFETYSKTKESTTCDYSTTDQKGLVRFTLRTFPTLKQARAELRLSLKSTELLNVLHDQTGPMIAKISQVRGVGDDSFLETWASCRQSLHVQKRMAVFEVIMSVPDTDCAPETLKTFARIVAAHF